MDEDVSRPVVKNLTRCEGLCMNLHPAHDAAAALLLQLFHICLIQQHHIQTDQYIYNTHTHSSQSSAWSYAHNVENDSCYTVQQPPPISSPLWGIIFLSVGRWGEWPTSRRRWSRLVLLRVPMMRRPIFLAYHTELSILLVAAAVAVMKVEVACRLLCASTRSCCRLQGGGGGAGWRADDGRGASLHFVSPSLHAPLPFFLLFLTNTNREAAEELMEEVMEVTDAAFSRGAETHRGCPPVSYEQRLLDVSR